VNKTATDTLSKVPAVTLGFWVIKIAATTLGETGGDAVTMTLNLGYLIGTLIFGLIFVAAVITQIFAKRFHPFLYWAVVVATTTVGTTLADFVDRSLGIGYLGGSAILFALVLVGLAVVVGASLFTKVSRTLLFWAAFILTRPLGATVGDLLDKPLAKGGLAFGRFSACAVLLAFMVVCILLLPRRAGTHP
jgi:uncharacterized membrane-anchored protein